MQNATILMSEFVTHDVKRFIVSKPEGFEWSPGQGVELAVDAPDWREETRPFSPTSLPEDRVLEFTIKGYPEHRGVTEKLHTLGAGDCLLISEPFGTITYQGPGTFIAGGAGITPFMAILRTLARDGQLAGNSLLFSNKTPDDVIAAKEFRYYLGERCTYLCSREAGSGCQSGRIDKAFLERHITDVDQRFYLCGPPKFVSGIKDALGSMGANPDAVVFER
ncbi:FAD-binding oxidoreductase [Thiohalomonas denitrificans]|uniref:Cytochrome-b5 reductase n=1 Tax=Thiohalomonas denitrificans TaxID=415747 RepID=A0A1G5QMG6_9GAMM|nr:FAD-binding oxidoreductase [Thiohalomonas denitrificans]SCZ62329.1 cytochrome-b5 reductase [Thiohalomonas denitrificans]